MNREQLIRALRRYARKRNIPFQVDTKKGNGSHYIVEVGSERTTLQSDLNRTDRASPETAQDRPRRPLRAADPLCSSCLTHAEEGTAT